MRYKTLFCLLVLSTVFAPELIYGQSNDSVFRAYIARYADEALNQKEHYNIPASITLAQGLLESNAGQSKLATEANNHFGIKCHSNWSGETYSSFDDGEMSCFRKYQNAEDSFEDHSLFIVGNSRYGALFKLKSSDYIGWAMGLKEFGYATDPLYAQKLIRIIETYELEQFDGNGKHTTEKAEKKPKVKMPTLSLRDTSPKQKKVSKAHLSKVEKGQIREAKKAERAGEWMEYKQTAGISDKDYGRSASEIRQSETKTLKAIPQHTIHRDQHGKYIIVQYGDTYESLQNELRLSQWELLNRNGLPMTHQLKTGETLYINSYLSSVFHPLSK